MQAQDCTTAKSAYRGRVRQPRSDAGLEAVFQAAGTVTNLAAALGMNTQAVSDWVRVPSYRCIDVERITGVSRHVQRPDVYGHSPVDS